LTQTLTDKVQIPKYGVWNWLPVNPTDIEEYLNALNVFDRKRDFGQYRSRKD
jgi:hypothetical protein